LESLRNNSCHNGRLQVTAICHAQPTYRNGPRRPSHRPLAVEDIDFKGGWIHINRQVRLVGTKQVFALPKGNKIRSVPLPAQLAAALKAHPPVAVTLPWAKPDGESKTFRLLFVDKK
jgi:integrase